jgi:TRAP-type mannitol/chloroaromatic compound transport system permease small subunit
MDRLKRYMCAVDKTNIFIGKVMVLLLALAVLVISFEVVMRYVFNRPTNWGHETMVLLFAILYVILGGYCHYYRAHVRVDVFYASRTPRTRAILDLCTSMFFFFYAIAFTYTSWYFYWSSQTMQGGGTLFGVDIPGELSLTDWGPPVYCVKIMMPLGGLLLLLQGINWFIRDLHLVVTGRALQ